MNRCYFASLGLFTIGGIVAVATAIVAVRDIRQAINDGVEARRKIHEDAKAEIEQTNYATRRVCQEIRAGRHDWGGLATIEESFRFHRTIPEPS